MLNLIKNMDSFNYAVNQLLDPFNASGSNSSDLQKLLGGLLKIVLVLYGSMIAPHLPDSVLKWFQYVPFKILILSLIVWTANHDPALSILIAVAFYASLNVIAGKTAFEAFREHKYHNLN